jgi:hypothetical protein
MDDYGLTVEVRRESGHVLVTVAGEMDIATVPPLRKRLAALAVSGRPLIVDLDRVTFIDASGLGCWPAWPARLARKGPACMWSASGTWSAACSPSPAWTARYRSPVL